MAIVTTDFLANALKNFRLLFANEFEAALKLQGWKAVTMELPSTSTEEVYNWLGTVPKMAELDGDFIFDDLETYNFSIVNKEFQAGFEVKRITFEDDKLGLVKPRISDLGLEAARYPGELIWRLFANIRVLGQSANIDNIGVGTGVTTVALIQADVATARAQMRAYQDDKGRPMDLIMNTIVVPPALEQIFFQALNAVQTPLNQPVVAAGTGDRFTASGYQVLVNPYLTDVNDWYGLAVGPGERMPFIYQNRSAPVFDGITDPRSDAGLLRRRFPYTAYSRFNVGVGDPRRAIRMVNS